MDPVRVLVVASDPLARGGLAALLAGRPDLSVTGEVAPEGVAGALAAAPTDALAWDLGLRAAAPDALRAVIDAGVPVLALLSDETQASDALRAGVRAVVSRGAAPEVLAAALGAVVRGLAVLDPAIAGAWLRPPRPARSAEALTGREREVLDLLAEGLSNKEIAARLGISEHTAKFHVNAILAKLGAGSRAEAIVLAARAGLVVL